MMEQKTEISGEMIAGRRKKTVGRKAPSGMTIGMIVKKIGDMVESKMEAKPTTMEKSPELQEDLTRTENMLLER